MLSLGRRHSCVVDVDPTKTLDVICPLTIPVPDSLLGVTIRALCGGLDHTSGTKRIQRQCLLANQLGVSVWLSSSDKLQEVTFTVIYNVLTPVEGDYDSNTSTCNNAISPTKKVQYPCTRIWRWFRKFWYNEKNQLDAINGKKCQISVPLRQKVLVS